MQTQTLPHGTQECIALCPVCQQQTLFRAAGGRPWFCTICGTPNHPQPVVLKVRGHGPRWPFVVFVTVLVIGGIVWGAGMLLAQAQIVATCYAGCSLTLSNAGPWPLRLDNITADGKPVQGFGPNLAGPFGSTIVELYDARGTLLMSAKTITYSVETVAGPVHWTHTLNLSSAGL